jgi:hypothetical protein
MSTVDDFARELRLFVDEDVVGGATDVLHEAAQTTAEAIVIGNEFGPGVPVDSAFLRSSFRVSAGEPQDGPTEPPATPGRKAGVPVFDGPLDLSAAATVPLGTDLYITTAVEYAVYLEEGANQHGLMARRFGVNAGAPTPFIAPVEQRFDRIVEDAARRVGYGG